MTAILFPLLLWGCGFIISTAFYKGSLSPVFWALAGVLSGAIFWSMGSILYLVVDVPYTPVTMALWLGGWVILAGLFHWRRQTWQFIRGEWLSISIVVVVFTSVMMLVVCLPFAHGSYDSFEQLFLARDIAHQHMTDATANQLSQWGIMLPMLHSVAFWFGEQFFTTLQPAFAFSLIGTLAYLGSISLSDDLGRWRLWLPILTSLVLGTNYFIIFEAFYIHNSILAAAYLLPAVVLLWRAHVEGNQADLHTGLFLLLGFAFTRTESVLFGAVFIILCWTQNAFAPVIWRRVLLPYTVVLLVWHFWLLKIIPSESNLILSTERVILMIGVLCTTYAATYLINIKTVLRLKLPTPNQLLLMALASSFGLAIVVNAQHMLNSTFYSIRNLFSEGFEWWGTIWYFTLTFLLILRPRRKVPYTHLFTQWIIAFFLLTWLLGSQRTPYRIGWGDSSNRMFTHILPIILFHLQLRIGHWLNDSKVAFRKSS